MNIALFSLLLKGALLTLEISLLGMGLGLLGGALIGICNAKKMQRFPWSYLFSFYVSLIRGTPLFVQILLLYFGLSSFIDLSPFTAGVIALGLNSAAYFSETIRGGINATPIEQWEAAQVLGYSKIQTLHFIIIPQVSRNILPSIVNELVSLVKESSLLMVLGVPELTKVCKDIVARELNPLPMYFLCALFYFLMTFSISWIAKKGEKSRYVN